MLDTAKLTKDFPILTRKVGDGKRLVYLDNAATSQKPQAVIDAISDFYSNHNANVHRGIHTLSEEATDMYESARTTIAEFIGATVPQEVVFTKGTTEAINRIMYEWGVENLGKDDVMLTTLAEHHSNFVPWQILSKLTGAKLEFINLTPDGNIDYEDLRAKFEKYKKRIKLIALSHASNTLGTIFDVKRLVRLCKENNSECIVAVDGAQAVPHMPVNVQSLGCDFYSFSGHKMLGPTGIGVMWTKRELLAKLEPYEYGGGMINEVTATTATWADPPEKFEAGTPPISAAIGLAAAVDYLKKVDMENVRAHEIALTEYALSKLKEIDGITLLGPQEAENRTGLVSFVLKGIHAHDIAAVLNTHGVAVRSGHHCTMPLHIHYGITASTRASFNVYNTQEDIDVLIEGLQKAIKILKG